VASEEVQPKLGKKVMLSKEFHLLEKDLWLSMKKSVDLGEHQI
jgi:hypothetical protein